MSDRAMHRLREYLDEVGFERFHKYLVSPNLYSVTPHTMGPLRRDEVCREQGFAHTPIPELRLALCLMLDVPIPRSGLNDEQIALVDDLCELGLLRCTDGWLRMGPYQLLTACGIPFFADRRLNFGGGTHDVYLGPDSLLLAHTVDPEFARGKTALELGTGSGLLSLYLSRVCRRVVATDIMPAPLTLAGLNHQLNARGDRLEIRRESFLDTFERAERFDLVVFNPPFVALPSELSHDGLAFAAGPGTDGLDYCRMFVELHDRILAPGGRMLMVASLPGSFARPHFQTDLDRYAKAANLAIDTYVEGLTDLTENTRTFELLAHYLAPANPQVERPALDEHIRRLYRDDLQADALHLAVMHITRAGPSGPRARCYNRFVRRSRAPNDEGPGV